MIDVSVWIRRSEAAPKPVLAEKKNPGSTVFSVLGRPTIIELMQKEDFTIVDEGRTVSVPVTLQKDRVLLDQAELERALFWELKPIGFCQGSTCIPIPDASSVVTEAGIDLLEFARLLDRPLALDAEERAAYLGTSAGDRGEALASLEAPDFALPDVDGELHSLSDYRGQKILLVAYASW